MVNWYRYTAVTAIILVIVVYLIKFTGYLGYISPDDPAVWGQFGDYMGGILNPLLSFVSITLLIKSLDLQNQANKSLLLELEENKKNEKLRSFSTLFFDMIHSQKTLLNEFFIVQPEEEILPGLIYVEDKFYIHDEISSKIKLKSGISEKKFGVDAIIFIENEVISKRNSEKTNDDEIHDFLQDIDSHEKIYGILRAFYISIKMICDNLSDDKGFDFLERKRFFLMLINFTDFSQLRLIIMNLQFMDYPPAKYIKNNSEFVSILNEVNMPLKLY